MAENVCLFYGNFASCDGKLYGVRIMTKGSGVAQEAAQLEFAGEEPLVIEWGETSKEEVICGSTATLTVVSPADRTFVGLYTVEAGSVWLEVIDEAYDLVWTGSIDTELYEEPYATAQNYEVTLTFSDFGILDRLAWQESGVVNCLEVIEAAVKAALNRNGMVEEWCATGMTRSVAGSETEVKFETGLELLAVHAENFYDEEGTAMTLKEVVEGILQPLGLRMVQRGGKVYVYDLESIYERGAVGAVKWMSDDQVLSVDKVVNNVEVELSTYGNTEVLAGDMDYPGAVEAGSVNFDSSDGLRYEKWSYYADLTRTGDVQFTVYTTPDGEWDFNTKPGLAQVGDGTGAEIYQAQWLHVDPLYGGEETDCVGVHWRMGITKTETTAVNRGYTIEKCAETVSTREGRQYVDWTQGRLIYRSYQGYLQELTAPGNYLLRVKIEMRLDARYNPFADGDENRKEESDKATKYVNRVVMRGRILLKDANGTVLRHVDNKSDRGCAWVDGDDEEGSMLFEWHDLTDASGAAVNSWMTNCNYKVPGSYLETEAQGTVVPYPTGNGYVVVELDSGVWLQHYNEKGAYEDTWGKNGIDGETFWWHLVKAPVVTIVNNDRKMTEVSTDDVVYSGVLNSAAKEELTVSTICGTQETENAATLSSYLDAELGVPLRKLTRAGRTTQVERLLIGTLYSQFAERKLKLTGTAALNALPWGLLTERSAGNALLLVTGEVADLQAGLTELTLVETRGDEYEEEDEG